MVHRNIRKQKINEFELNVIEAVKIISLVYTKISHCPMNQYVEECFPQEC
jgi:hypothetical protein